MNNKNITILTISITGVLILAIAFLVLTIFKGNEMKEWFKKNILCCFGKKEEEKKVEEKPVVNQGQSRIPYTSEEDKRDLAIALQAIRDMKGATNEIKESTANLLNIQNQLFIEEVKEIVENKKKEEENQALSTHSI